MHICIFYIKTFLILSYLYMCLSISVLYNKFYSKQYSFRLYIKINLTAKSVICFLFHFAFPEFLQARGATSKSFKSKQLKVKFLYNCYFLQGSEGIRQWQKNLCTSPMMIHIINPYVDYNQRLKRLETQLNELTNKN